MTPRKVLCLGGPAHGQIIETFYGNIIHYDAYGSRYSYPVKSGIWNEKVYWVAECQPRYEEVLSLIAYHTSEGNLP